MAQNNIALMIYGKPGSDRDALTEEKYRDLADSFINAGFNVKSVLYNDESAGRLASTLLEFDAVLVWVNPIEQGNDRRKLDTLLTEISTKGCFVSCHPEVILKIGTKKVLFETRNMAWGRDTKMYKSYEEFRAQFYESLKSSGTRVIKQYRGNGGNGVYKIINSTPGKEVTLIHAIAGNESKQLSLDEFFLAFQPFFQNGGLLIDQEWCKNIANGMVRCYLTGAKVSGFGYQEINALYELPGKTAGTYYPPGKRYYYTENCGLFSDLKKVMENDWVPQLQQLMSIDSNRMPVIWDADFFINKTGGEDAAEKYSLREINVSSVSPFPPSAIKFIVSGVRDRIRKN